MSRKPALWLAIVLLVLIWPDSTRAVVLWSDLSATLVFQTGVGNDVLGGAVKRDDTANDTLYFKFHIDPISDTSTEEYFAAFELFEHDEERLGVGNALKAWAYSAFTSDGPGDVNKDSPYIDLHSSRPEPTGHGAFYTYENPHRGFESTIIIRVKYVSGGEDVVTVWLNPDLGPGATETAQPESLITRFTANASFDEIHLRHGGGGGGWVFSDMEIATSFSDFVKAGGEEANSAISRLVRGEQPVTFHYWQREQGLPQNTVRALAQTEDGYLWIGNDDGVVRFDGVRFVSFGLREGLNSGPVEALCAGKAGSLWIGSAGAGLTHYDGEKFLTYTMKDGLPADSITALAADDDGNLWIGTRAGLVIWRDGHESSLNDSGLFKGKNVTTLYKDRGGTMWIGATGAGVYHARNGQFVGVKDAAVENFLQDPHCVLVDNKGHLWIGAGDDLVLCLDGTQWQPYRIPSHQSRAAVETLAEGPDGTVWAGSASEGLFHFKDGKIQAINAANGLSDNLIESLLVDREGGLWVGTHGGLNRMHFRNLFTLGQKEGLGYGAVQGLVEVAPGAIWAGKATDGLYVWEGGNFRKLAAAGLTLGGQQINSLIMAHDGTCWAAGAHGLLHFTDLNAVTNQVEVFADVHGTALAEDRAGNLWVGTREGEVWRYSRGAWTREAAHWQSYPITAIGEARDGYMWIGSEGGGLDRFKGNERTHFDRQSGLLSELVRTLYVDDDGVAWIGTAGGGLSRWRDGKMFTFTTHEGLPDNTISQLLEDQDGRLWLGTSRGIACVSKKDLEELAAGRVPAVTPLVYGRAEGMVSEECTGGFSPSGLKAKSGLLWFSTLKGVVVLDPRPHSTETSPPNVLLEEVLLDGVRATLPEKSVLRISPGQHRVEFHYTGMSFDSPERVRFKYRLDGLDADWLEAGTLRSILYNYIPPGHYTFRVAARNANGSWVESGSGLAVAVAPYFWQIWWVRVLAGIGILVAVGGAVRVAEKRKSQQRLQRLEQEKALERERTRIAQDLHDEMGAKLCRISFLSEHARRIPQLPAEVHRQISSISDSSREVLTSLDEIVWAINPKNDLLEHLVSYIGHYAREYFQETGVECELNIPAQVPLYPLSSQLRHHLLLAVHEAFTNVLKHSGATRSRISITCNGDGLEIVVSDNGHGFKVEANATNGATHASAQGNGLRNMRQRLMDIGGDCQISSDPAGGTTIQFTLPLATNGMGKVSK